MKLKRESRTENRKAPLVLLAIGLLAVMAFFSFSFRQAVGSSLEADVIMVADEQEIEYGAQYAIGIDNTTDEAVAHLEYTRDSIEGIEKYIAFNQWELQRISDTLDPSDTVPVEITFAAPLNQMAFVEFVETHDLAVDHYTMYVVRGAGDLAAGDLTTVQGKPARDEIVPTAEMEMVLKGVNENAGADARFVGWVSVSGTIQVAQAAKVNSDRHVFLMDVTDTFVNNLLTESRLREAGVAWSVRRSVLRDGLTEIYRPPLAYSLVRLGILSLETE